MSARSRWSSPELLLLLAGGISGPAAHANAEPCDVEVSAPVVQIASYDWLNGNLSGSIATEIRGKGDACEAEVRLTDVTGAPLRSLKFGPHEVAIRLQPLATQDAIAGSDEASVHVSVPSDGHAVRARWLVIGTTSEVVPAGDYEADFQILGGVEPVRGGFVLHAVPKAQANFAGGSPNQTIDLGELRPGKVGRAMLQIRANTRPTITFTSQNQGWLRNLALPDAKIPYALYFEGDRAELSGAWQRTVDIPLVIQGQSFELDVVIGQFSGAAAGTYSDQVEVEVSP